MVAAFRDSRGLEFYWDANVRRNDELEAAQIAGRSDSYQYIRDLLPYAFTRDFATGRGFVEAGIYYDCFREHLPPAVRERADAFFRMLYPEDLERTDDLSTDAGVPPDADIRYAMRPATVRTALARAAAVPWTVMAEIGERTVVPEMSDSRYVPDYSLFADHLVYQQRAWLSEAAAADRGLVVLMSY
jgi:hypothetical protein